MVGINNLKSEIIAKILDRRLSNMDLKLITKPKNANGTCRCGKIILDGEPVGSCGHDSLGRPKVICLNCRNA